MTELFAPLPAETARLLEAIPELLDKTFPVPARFRGALVKDVAELSRLLTSARGERELSYLSRPRLLQAYLRYFLPWNIFRLCRLLPALDISLAPDDAVLDIGCGPLTFAAALWISRPEFRQMPLELRCVDRTAAVLEAGKKFFTALAGSDCPWKIKTIRGSVTLKGTIAYAAGKKQPARRYADKRANNAADSNGEKPAALVCAINLFNEMYGNKDNARDFDEAACAARLLDSCAAPAASILIVEPGVPRAGEFIRLLRGAFIERGRLPLSPCTHSGACPFPGGDSGAGKKRWCHFAFETEDAPAALRKLSAAAGIPKERAALSFFFAGAKDMLPAVKNQAPHGEKTALRVISDAFPLPAEKGGAKSGRYCCSARGLVLLAGNSGAVESRACGTRIDVNIAKPERRDPKSGALLAAVSDAANNNS